MICRYYLAAAAYDGYYGIREILARAGLSSFGTLARIPRLPWPYRKAPQKRQEVTT